MRFSIFSITFLLGVGLGHPGHDLTDEILERRSFKSSIRSASLSHCADVLKARGIESRNVQRRAALLEGARLNKGTAKRRDVDDALGTSHNETSLGYDLDTSTSDLFSGNASCVLTPEVTQGPYCKFDRETFRRSMELNRIRRWRRSDSKGHYGRPTWARHLSGLPGHRRGHVRTGSRRLS